eukprot:scaffold260208_cov28-Tisochrysis_lutea.AAC.1
MWNVYILAPASLKSSTHCAGRETMRWQSKNAVGRWERRHLRSGAPNVRFGTKWPSITSRCSQSAPAESTRCDSEAREDMSEARSEGQMRMREAADIGEGKGERWGRRPRA